MQSLTIIFIAIENRGKVEENLKAIAYLMALHPSTNASFTPTSTNC
jgi:hypothetical protein